MELSSPKNFPNSKNKSINYEKHSYILGNRTFLPQAYKAQEINRVTLKRKFLKERFQSILLV